jgi:hypothetical protein
MNYHAATATQRTEFMAQLRQVTLADLAAAAGDARKLDAAVQRYFSTASAAQLALDEIENILGVDEPSIMDLAQLSEADEEIVIAAFEQLITL